MAVESIPAVARNPHQPAQKGLELSDKILLVGMCVFMSAGLLYLAYNSAYETAQLDAFKTWLGNRITGAEIFGQRFTYCHESFSPYCHKFH